MMKQISSIVLALIAMVSLGNAADEPRRFPRDHITVEEWNTYLAEVKALPNVTVRESNQQITISQQKPELTIYAFTTPNNPAHPGIVIRKLVKSERGIDMQRVGYYAGSAEVFTRWWHAFDALDDKIRADMGVSSAESPTIQVRKIKDGRFQLTLTSKSIATVDAAQRALVPKVLELCAGRRPSFGEYRFDKLEKVDSPTSTSGVPVSFKFDQEVACE